MCTVTFIAAGNMLFLTSSRDERYERAPALPPRMTRGSTGKLLFPADGNKGGSWIGLHEAGHAVILLNGAWEAHIPQPPYRKSRGLILLEVLDSIDPVKTFYSVDLKGVEPFTLIIVQEGNLFEGRWDGKVKHTDRLDPARKHIWSSATLYPGPVRQERTKWFEQWLKENAEPDSATILDFHKNAGNHDRYNAICMERPGDVHTVSITQIHFSEPVPAMLYHDTSTGLTGHYYIGTKKEMARPE